MRSGREVGLVAASPLPSRGPQTLHNGGQNQRWLTSGRSGNITPAVFGGGGGGQHFNAGDKIRVGPQENGVAT